MPHAYLPRTHATTYAFAFASPACTCVRAMIRVTHRACVAATFGTTLFAHPPDYLALPTTHHHPKLFPPARLLYTRLPRGYWRIYSNALKHYYLNAGDTHFAAAHVYAPAHVYAAAPAVQYSNISPTLPPPHSIYILCHTPPSCYHTCLLDPLPVIYGWPHTPPTGPLVVSVCVYMCLCMWLCVSWLSLVSCSIHGMWLPHLLQRRESSLCLTSIIVPSHILPYTHTAQHIADAVSDTTLHALHTCPTPAHLPPHLLPHTRARCTATCLARLCAAFPTCLAPTRFAHTCTHHLCYLALLPPGLLPPSVVLPAVTTLHGGARALAHCTPAHSRAFTCCLRIP